jgi:hypothetical protein
VDQAAAAITNALSTEQFHGALLINAPYDDTAKRWGSATASNVWILGGADQLTTVSTDGKMLPYSANFDVVAIQLAANQCKILVKTTGSWVIAGKTINIHGGPWAWRGEEYPPILEEEAYVLDRIETQLRALQSR